MRIAAKVSILIFLETFGFLPWLIYVLIFSTRAASLRLYVRDEHDPDNQPGNDDKQHAL